MNYKLKYPLRISLDFHRHLRWSSIDFGVLKLLRIPTTQWVKWFWKSVLTPEISLKFVKIVLCTKVIKLKLWLWYYSFYFSGDLKHWLICNFEANVHTNWLCQNELFWRFYLRQAIWRIFWHFFCGLFKQCISAVHYGRVSKTGV